MRSRASVAPRLLRLGHSFRDSTFRVSVQVRRGFSGQRSLSDVGFGIYMVSVDPGCTHFYYPLWTTFSPDGPLDGDYGPVPSVEHSFGDAATSQVCSTTGRSEQGRASVAARLLRLGHIFRFWGTLETLSVTRVAAATSELLRSLSMFPPDRHWPYFLVFQRILRPYHPGIS